MYCQSTTLRETKRKRTVRKPNFYDFYVDIRNSCNHTDLVTKLNKFGLVTFEGIQSKLQVEELALSLGKIHKHRDADERGVTVISPSRQIKAQSSYLGFTSEALLPHTDGSSNIFPPMLILMACKRSSEEGGQSVFVDGKAIYGVLKYLYPKTLERLTAPNSIIFGLEPQHVGAVFEKSDVGNYTIRFRFDNWGYFSAPVTEELPVLQHLIRSYSFAFKLKVGQGYIVQNGRWLHGRRAFTGERLMYRVLIDIATDNSSEHCISFGFNHEGE